MAEEPPKPETIRFVYEKGRHHRSFHADGAWASSTPLGEVQVSFYNDLHPIPATVVHALSEGGKLGAELSRDVRDNDVVREVNVTVVMNPPTIKALMILLGSILAKIEKETATPDVEESKESAKSQ